MAREYDEKRDFIRLDIDCKIIYKKVDSEEQELTGHVSNLSGRGMMFIVDRALDKDNIYEININPSNILTPSLHANVKVVRVVKQRHADGYEIGAIIREIYDEE